MHVSIGVKQNLIIQILRTQADRFCRCQVALTPSGDLQSRCYSSDGQCALGRLYSGYSKVFPILAGRFTGDAETTPQLSRGRN